MKPTLNLASRTYLNRRLLYAGYGLTAALLILLVVSQSLYLWHSSRETRSLGERLGELQQQEQVQHSQGERPFTPADYERVQQRIAFANEVLSQDRFRWTDLFDRLEVLTPGGIGLRSIQPNVKTKAVTLVGEARNLDALQTFLEQTLGAPDFSAVYLLRQEQLDLKSGLGPDALRFNLELKGAF